MGGSFWVSHVWVDGASRAGRSATQVQRAARRDDAPDPPRCENIAF